ncbi:MAG: carbohydrate binding family 9 domain-containing protein [Phaeodactylibacter sp.]|nr:carbohydrate binding family 9 domain-containing protein [Phaeodactylibacter sp.]MCB9050806.1 carbohydrate binding family 9 domain-containing protein [Lewinellaceae bacterium]
MISMPLYRKVSILFSLVLLVFGPGGYAQGNGDSQYTAERPATQAFSTEQAPVIDGNVREDPVWQAIPPVTELWQVQPNAGLPASEPTEIRIAYDKETFFVSVVAFDADPEGLVVTDARRDASLDNTDCFLFILDTYNDSQNGFVFGTNFQGVEYDAQVNNEGQGNFNSNRQQGGTIGGFNINWDASWEVEAEVGDYGWSAEFAIPFRTLRFASGPNQAWGINFRRNIRKTNEIAYWAKLPIQFDLNRLSLAGKLTGLNLQKPGNLKLIPYVLGQAAKDFETADPETEFTADAGVDLKYSITSGMTLDLTYNTDFAQVEVDDQQVNLDRFNLFFPEKRPFFLENAGLFSVGSPGEVDLFFSRRIGIGEEGRLVPIIGGARVSGKVNRSNIGLLSMFTDEVEDAGIRQNNFTVARFNHEFAQRSYVGAAFVNREGMGEVEDDFNRVFAADGRFGLGKKAQLSGFYARSVTPGIRDQVHSFKVQSQYEWNGLSLNAAYTEVGEGFNPEVGFLLRNAFRKPEFRILKQIRPEHFIGILELRPHVSYSSYWSFDNFLQTSFLHVDNHWEFKNGMEVHTGINFTVEGVSEDFEIANEVIVPTGSYHHREAQLVFFTNPSKAVSFNIRSVMGGFFGGTRKANTVSLVVLLGEKFNSEFALSNNDIRLPGGAFTTNVFRSRLAYAFTPRIYLQSLVQYNSVAELWSVNVRFGLLQQANTGLFLVWNENYGATGINNRSFVLKYSRMFDVLK